MTGTRDRTRGAKVQRVYEVGSARWYDIFRTCWTWFTARPAEKELDRLLLDYAGDGCRVLDIGCGTGYNLGRLQRLEIDFASYRGTDLTPAMLDIARDRYRDETRATFEVRDLHDLADDHDRYDLILCTWVASHLDRPRDVFEIAFLLLSPGRHALILTLTRPARYVTWWFTPFARLFQVGYVEPETFQGLPGSSTRHTWTAGMTTLVDLTKPPADPTIPHHDGTNIPTERQHDPI